MRTEFRSTAGIAWAMVLCLLLSTYGCQTTASVSSESFKETLSDEPNRHTNRPGKERPMPIRIQLHHVHDFALTSSTVHGNPFTVSLSATLTHDSGEVLTIPGFYDGNGTWKIRFSPTREGLWRGTTASDDLALDGVELGPVEGVANTNPRAQGIPQIDPDHHQRFAWSNGTPFVPLGFECDWLFSYHQADPDRCRKHIDLIADRGFNTIVMNLYAHEWFTGKAPVELRPGAAEHLYSPSKLYPFGGTNDAPDHTRLNPAFFHDFDRLVSSLHERGVVAHLMIQVQNKQVRWPKWESPEDDRFWRYVVARYQAFGNVVWDVGKESKNLVRKASHTYVQERMDLIRSVDAYGHLVTVHDAEHRNSGGQFSELDEAADFVSDQVHLQDVDGYNREAIRRLRTLPKPYMNIEYGYELGVESFKTHPRRSTTWDNVLKWTWAIYLAGAYPCYYYDNVSWDLIKFEPEPPSWARYRDMKAFIDALPFNRMKGDNEFVERGLCLAEPGRVYLVYLPEGGDTSLDLSAVDDGTRLTVEWMDIFTGIRKQTGLEKESDWSGFNTALENPFDDPSQPCVLAVRAQGTSD
jgi:hypothetical protein